MKITLCSCLIVLAAGCGFLPKESDEEALTLPEPPRITQAITYI